jgi:hypothetical protein
MPIIAGVDHEERRVRAIAVGPVSYDDVRDHLLLQRSTQGLSYPEFVDARGAGFTFTSSDVRRVIDLLRSVSRATQAQLGPTAVLVSTDSALGVLDGVALLIEDACVMKAFCDEQEALAWLEAK